MLKRSIILLVFLAACVDPFNPPVLSTGIGLLVVDGFINSGAGATTFTLSRTMDIESSAASRKELRANVTVEDENRSSQVLAEKGNGVYAANQLTIDPQHRYRIRIKTTAGQEYSSDLVEVKKTPPIKNIEWRTDKLRNGLSIFLDTEDPENMARYYRWEYEETWAYHTDYATRLDYKNGRVIQLPTDIFTCWRSRQSTNILTATSEKSSRDVINDLALNFVDANKEELSVGYSLLARQYAITREAYDYWDKLKKNTETLGSIFDAQPSEIVGNIHNTSDAEEVVIGFVSITHPEEKRFFIGTSDLPPWFYYLRKFCPEEESKPPPFTLEEGLANGYYIPIGYLLADSYTYKPRACTDCRVKGGVAVRPDYWPQ